MIEKRRGRFELPFNRHLIVVAAGSCLLTVATCLSAESLMRKMKHIEPKDEAVDQEQSIGFEKLVDNLTLGDYMAKGKQTATEKTLTHALQKSGNTDIMLQCAPIPLWQQEEQNATDSASSTVIAYVYTKTAYAKARPDICDGAILAVDRSRLFRNGSDLDAAAIGVETLSHENQHLIHPQASESEVECYAIQETAALAKSLGASAIVADQIGKRAAQLMPDREPDEYITPDTCYDGGPYDLDLLSPGNFPRVKPANNK